MKKTGIGIIGCGAISGIYLKNAARFGNIELVACADLLLERAEARAAEFGVPKACGVEQLLRDESVEIVLNLTIPKAHAEVALACAVAGKHVYGEKPLAVTRADGSKMLAAAGKTGVRVGCAPDTVLGAGIQTCRKLIDAGAIGEPVGCQAFMLCRGHESWHPDPEFYYEKGGGPLFDMGPYYLTALISLLGPVAAVAGSTRISFAERLITSKPKAGKRVPVEVPTHVTGLLEFGSGIPGVIVTSFDVWATTLPRIEIYGSESTLLVPDPNTFGGPVKLWNRTAKAWEEVPFAFPYETNSRGLGAADMAAAIAAGRPHRANGELAYHVLDVMTAIHEAGASGKKVMLESTCERPAPMPAGLKEGEEIG